MKIILKKNNQFTVSFITYNYLIISLNPGRLLGSLYQHFFINLEYA